MNTPFFQILFRKHIYLSFRFRLLDIMPTVQKPNHCLGIFLLLVVNVAWVASSEITKYLYNDLNFKRPFFATYIKSCMFTLFLIRYACSGNSSEAGDSSDSKLSYGEPNYSKLDDNASDDDYEVESLTAAEFESLHDDSEDIDKVNDIDALSITKQNILISDLFGSDAEYKRTTNNFEPIFDNCNNNGDNKNSPRKSRRVRFSMFREVRSFPEKIQNEAKLARLAYKSPNIHWTCKCSPIHSSQAFTYSLYFAPLWFLTSVSYQVSLIYSSVFTVNLISASSPLFVLILGSFFGTRNADRFTCGKLLLVLVNFCGVAIVSQFSTSVIGLTSALFSALTYAMYLVAFTYVLSKCGRIDMNLMFGVIGVFSFIVCTPLLILLHLSGTELQSPAPTQEQFGIVVFVGFFGSLFADYLWLYATVLTNSLISSISLTLAIPLSMIADSAFRGQFPDSSQMLASIPIMISFIGASFLTSSSPGTSAAKSSSPMMNNCDSSFIPGASLCGRCLGALPCVKPFMKQQRNSRSTLRLMLDLTNDDILTSSSADKSDKNHTENVRLMEAMNEDEF